MLQWFFHFSDAIMQGIQLILDFLYDNTVGVLKGLCLYYLKISAVFMYIKMHVALELAVDLFDAYIAPIDLKGEVNEVWLLLPTEIRSFLCFLRLPDAISLILSAYILRVMRAMIPFLR